MGAIARFRRTLVYSGAPGHRAPEIGERASIVSYQSISWAVPLCCEIRSNLPCLGSFVDPLRYQAATPRDAVEHALGEFLIEERKIRPVIQELCGVS